MKIAINTLPISPHMTGIGTYTKSLVDATDTFGAPHKYIYFSGNGLNIKGNSKQILVKKADMMWEQLHLPSIMKFWQVDLYHSPLFTCPIVDEVPCVITIHDVIPEIRPDLCSLKFLDFYHFRIAPSVRAATKVITTSEFSKQEMVKYLKIDPAKVEVIYQGISPEFSPRKLSCFPELRNRLGLPEKYILYVGMIEPRKNIENLITAFAKVAAQFPDLHLVLAGRKDSPQYNLDAVKEKTKVASRISEMGYVSQQDLPILYAGASMFVFLSLYEGFGRPVVEAMASGVPVITSNISSLPEITKDAALLVDPENIDDIAQAVSKVYENQSIKDTLIERGSKRALDFSHQKFGKRLVEFYNNILATDEVSA